MRIVHFFSANVWLLLGLVLVSGCGTSFKYNPRHDQAYPSVSIQPGVEIVHAEDLRAEDERQPEWSRKVGVITARALADELNYARLFRRVKIHLSGASANGNYSHFIELRVKQFRYYNPTNALDFGRTALSWLGFRGALIARSIPREYISQVEVEIIVLDARNSQAVLDKTYSATRSLTANGYESKSREIQQTSEALEAVVEQFVADLLKGR